MERLFFLKSILFIVIFAYVSDGNACQISAANVPEECDEQDVILQIPEISDVDFAYDSCQELDLIEPLRIGDKCVSTTGALYRKVIGPFFSWAKEYQTTLLLISRRVFWGTKREIEQICHSHNSRLPNNNELAQIIYDGYFRNDVAGTLWTKSDVEMKQGAVLIPSWDNWQGSRKSTKTAHIIPDEIYVKYAICVQSSSCTFSTTVTTPSLNNTTSAEN